MDRIVDQRAIALFDGMAGLHEIGILGTGIVVGLVDSGVSTAKLGSYVMSRETVVPDTDGDDALGHGTAMATIVAEAAPDARLASVRVFDRRNRLFRPALAEGIDKARAEPAVQILNLSIEIARTWKQVVWCSQLEPCVACVAASAAVEEGKVVVAAVGNLGPDDDSITCPGAARGVISVGATDGPTGSSSPPAVPALTETGTSPAAALTSGGCALLLSAYPDLGMAEIKSALAATSTRMPDAHVNAVGFGGAHFYRAWRYLDHLRRGGTVDVPAAEALAGEALAVGHSEREAARTLLKRAIEFAPWGGALRLALAQLAEQDDLLLSFTEAQESIRLDWSSADAHRLLSRLLDGLGQAGAARVEAQISSLLSSGNELGAADALFDGLRTRERIQMKPSDND